jgi:hypothetical protein
VRRVEGYDADRLFILSTQQIADHGLLVGFVLIYFAISAADLTEVVQNETDFNIKAWQMGYKSGATHWTLKRYPRVTHNSQQSSATGLERGFPILNAGTTLRSTSA